jgi:DNA-binding NtrC family response regulator
MDFGETILVAVDDETVAEWVAEFIREGGGSAVSVALSGEQALRALDDHTVGVVFADLVPQGGMHSRELALIIKDRYPGIPVICAAEEPRGADSAGCVMVQKPYSWFDLVDAIKETAPSCLTGGHGGERG